MPMHADEIEIPESLVRSLVDRQFPTGRRSTRAWPGPGVWIHGDLLGGNLLVRDGRLSAVGVQTTR